MKNKRLIGFCLLPKQFKQPNNSRKSNWLGTKANQAILCIVISSKKGKRAQGNMKNYGYK